MPIPVWRPCASVVKMPGWLLIRPTRQPSPGVSGAFSCAVFTVEMSCCCFSTALDIPARRSCNCWICCCCVWICCSCVCICRCSNSSCCCICCAVCAAAGDINAVPQSSAAHLRKVLDDIATTSWLPNDPCFPVEHEDEPGAGLKQARMPLDLRTPQVADLVL